MPDDSNSLHVEQMDGFVPPTPERSISVFDMLAAAAVTDQSAPVAASKPEVEQ